MSDVPNQLPDPEPAEPPIGPGPDLPPAQPGEDPGIVDGAPGGDAPI